MADAVATLSNTDGGLVLVGVKDSGSTGEARIVGVPRSEHDALVSQLYSVMPNAMPEVIPVAIPGKAKLVIVLRIVLCTGVLELDGIRTVYPLQFESCLPDAASD